MNDIINIDRSDHGATTSSSDWSAVRMQSLRRARARHGPAGRRDRGRAAGDSSTRSARRTAGHRRNHRRARRGGGHHHSGAQRRRQRRCRHAQRGGAAVRRRASSDEDLLGMIDVVDPAEVPALRAAAEQGAAEAQRIDLLDAGFSLEAWPGCRRRVADLALRPEQLTDGVAVVTATRNGLHFVRPGGFPIRCHVARDHRRADGDIQHDRLWAPTVTTSVSPPCSATGAGSSASATPSPSTPGVAPMSTSRPGAGRRRGLRFGSGGRRRRSSNDWPRSTWQASSRRPRPVRVTRCCGTHRCGCQLQPT